MFRDKSLPYGPISNITPTASKLALQVILYGRNIGQTLPSPIICLCKYSFQLPGTKFLTVYQKKTRKDFLLLVSEIKVMLYKVIFILHYKRNMRSQSPVRHFSTLSYIRVINRLINRLTRRVISRFISRFISRLIRRAVSRIISRLITKHLINWPVRRLTTRALKISRLTRRIISQLLIRKGEVWPYRCSIHNIA